jgi:hypothetical protein
MKSGVGVAGVACTAGSTLCGNEVLGTVEILSLDGDGSFRANRGFETYKTVGE